EAVVAITARDPEDSRRRTATFLDLDEIAVFGDDYGASLASLLIDLRVLCPEEAQILYVSGLALSKISQPSGESGRKLGINPDWEGRSHRLCGQCRMIKAPCRVPQASGDVVRFQVGIRPEDLVLALTGSQEVEDVAHPDAHPADAGAATT